MGATARSQRTPMPTRTPLATATSDPTPEVAGVQSSTPEPSVDDMLMQTLEPLFVGGRIGLAGAAISIAAWVVNKPLRGQKTRR
jgi:hypothetical protein